MSKREMQSKLNLKTYLIDKFVKEFTKDEVKEILKKESKKKGYKVDSCIDEHGREVLDQTKIVTEVKELTPDQRRYKEFVKAHNKAVLEKENLGFDISNPEVLKDLLDLEMEDEKPEFFSQYEYLPMPEDIPT